MKLPALAPQNLLDKAIAYVAPKIAMERMASRAQLALVGGYTGARVDRASLARYRPGRGSPTTDQIRDLPMLRGRSRDQMRNAPAAVGALNTTVSHVVGTGLSLSPAIDADFLGLSVEEAGAWQADTARRFTTWATSTDCDLARHLNFYGVQELAFRSTLESGDAFVLTPWVVRAGRPAQLALQLLEADRVCSPDGTMNTPELIDGVHIAPETGEAIAYEFCRQHPGDVQLVRKWDKRPARGDGGRRNVLHLFRALRPGQVRGVPWIAPVLEPLKMLGRFTEAELRAAVTSSLFSVFVRMSPDAFVDLFDDDAQQAIISKAGNWSGEMEDGKAVNLLPGEEIQSPTPGRPSPQFDPFVQSILKQIGMALELPYEVLVMSYQSSYSASRASLLMAWKFFRGRRDWLATYLCQPVYELWLSHEIAEGRIAAPGFFADEVVRAAWCGATWVGDGPGSINPEKDVAAAQARVDMGISTLQAESILHDGVDWESKQRQRAKEVAIQKRDGTLPESPPASAGRGDNARPGNKANPNWEEED